MMSTEATEEMEASDMEQFEGQELRTEDGYSLGVLETANLRGGRHKFRVPGGKTVSRPHDTVQIKLRSHDGLAFRTPEGDF